MSRSIFKLFAKVGPGGIRCECCSAHSSKGRRAIKRSARKRMKAADRKRFSQETGARSASPGE